MGAFPLKGIKHIVLSNSIDEFSYITGNVNLIDAWSTEQGRQELLQEYPDLKEGNKTWVALSEAMGKSIITSKASMLGFYRKEAQSIYLRPDIPIDKTRKAFIHECGHVIYFNSDTKKAWEDSHKGASEIAVIESFAENYVTYINSRQNNLVGESPNKFLINVIETVIKGQRK